MVSPQMRREAVLVMQLEIELSQRRACGLMELYLATCRYRRRRSEDEGLRVRLRELAEARRRLSHRGYFPMSDEDALHAVLGSVRVVRVADF